MRRFPDGGDASSANLRARLPVGRVLERMQAGFDSDVAEMALCCLRRFVRSWIGRRGRRGCREKANVCLRRHFPALTHSYPVHYHHTGYYVAHHNADKAHWWQRSRPPIRHHHPLGLPESDPHPLHIQSTSILSTSTPRQFGCVLHAPRCRRILARGI